MTLGQSIDGNYLGRADKSGAIDNNPFDESTEHHSTPQANNRTAGMDYQRPDRLSSLLRGEKMHAGDGRE